MNYKEYICPNVLCRATNCFKHCNHCGNNIKWTNYLGDPYYETNKKGKRVRYAYEDNDTVHRCMREGTKDGKFINKFEPNEYKLDEYRTIRRYGGPVWKCDFCGVRGDLPVMMNHHTNEKQFDCNDKLMKKFFKEKPKTYIDTNNYRIDQF